MTVQAVVVSKTQNHCSCKWNGKVDLLDLDAAMRGIVYQLLGL